MRRPVVLAPVPWEHLESAESEPHLLERIFFGSSSPNVPHFTIGLPVFIYGSLAGTRRVPRGAVTWGGTLGAVDCAVKSGPRSGKFRDPSLRPPTAEAGDTGFLAFFEVLRLHRLAPPRALSEFTKVGGKGKPYTGDVPQWPVPAELDC